ncbi:ribonuclease P protein component [Croceitalea vernalis]|uniref:Ribonuclease P protein component n=1 Tax=Croceitalea vernalis TaxID=3075599 RepID=A0ABU3BDP3_9FLAO|nr:ribonuclease P protein component [Croceitalea sp. P007]MDT0620448.1 ribonuclease P protein component [Croceitalea sp. P007]
MDYSFPKREKLKSKKAIDLLFAEGKHLNNFPLKLIYLEGKKEPKVPFKTMVVAPKKSFKSAVKRNRIKRLLRESFRLNKHLVFNNIEGNYTFAILYLGKEMPEYHFIDEKMKGLLDKFLKKIAHEKAP